jgi:hypothetical protein
MAYDLAYATERDVHYYERSVRISRDYIYEQLRRLAFESAFGPGYGLRGLLAQSVKQKLFYPTRRYWCTKTFPGEATARGLMALYPSAKFIWILRNGMSVVHSRTKFPEFRELEFRDHCKHWADSIHRFAYLRKFEGAVVIRQEELSEDPEDVFGRIFALVGVPYHPASTQFASENLVHPLADEGTTPGVDVKQVHRQRTPPYEKWNEQERALFKEICGDAMAIAGYPVPY